MSTQSPEREPYSTLEVSQRSGYSVGTLVFYACVQRQQPEDRRQQPPQGMPRPTRVGLKLYWPALETDQWLASRPKRSVAKRA